LRRERVVEAEKPLQVAHRGELGGDAAGRPLRRGVRRAQLRVLLLQLPDLAHLLVVLGVGDERRIQDVVPVVVLGDLHAQVGVPAPRRVRSLAHPDPSSISSRSNPAASPHRALAPTAPREHGGGAPPPAPGGATPPGAVALPARPGPPSRATGQPSRCHSPVTACAAWLAGGGSGAAAVPVAGITPARIPRPASTASARPSSPARPSLPRSHPAAFAPAPMIMPNGTDRAQQCTTVNVGTALMMERRPVSRSAGSGTGSRFSPLAVGTSPAITAGKAGSSSWSTIRAPGTRLPTSATCAAMPSPRDAMRSATAPGSARAGSWLRISSTV